MHILKRFIGIVVAIIPFGIVLILSMVDWRLFAGKIAFLGYCLFAFGGLVSCINFYLSFLRYPLHRLRGGKKENYRWISGIPLLGILCVAGLVLLPKSFWFSLLTFIFLLIDTAGIPWFVIAVWKDDSIWSNDTSKSNRSASHKDMKGKKSIEHRNIAAKLLQEVLDGNISAEEVIQRWPHCKEDTFLENLYSLFFHYRDDADIRAKDEQYAMLQRNEVRKMIKDLQS
jgi:hypothetical protein